VSATATAVEAAIATVIDPCSVAARAPLSVFELGLVRAWSVDDDGRVAVSVSPTAPSCILIGSIVRGIEERVAEVDGVTAVDVEIDGHTVWSPELMTADARAKLERRQQRSMAEVPVRPRQWEEERDGRAA
jgi:metal-sulfur cluster biosynthetic enzyme